MRVLLVSGIFFPEVGGPATHVRKIAEHFSRIGWDVTVVAFGDQVGDATPYRVFRTSRRYPKLLSWVLYACSILSHTAHTDVVYAFDLTTAGIPAWIASTIFRKKFIVRIGGDPIWEREAEAGRRLIPMDDYYAERLHLQDRPGLYRILHSVLRAADRIVVYNEMFKNFYITHFSVEASKISVVRNPIPAKGSSAEEVGSRTLIFAGRFVLYKNLERVIRAAATAFKSNPEGRLLFVGDGPEKEKLEILAHELSVPLTIKSKVAQAELFELIRSSSVALAPALSEFNPNFILEAISFGKPAAISNNNGLSVSLPAYMQFDPMDEGSIARTFELLLSDDGYTRARNDIAQVPLDWSWPNVLKEQEAIVASV